MFVDGLRYEVAQRLITQLTELEPVTLSVTCGRNPLGHGLWQALGFAGCRVAARKLLIDLPDEVATRVTVIFYADVRDALLKALNK